MITDVMDYNKKVVAEYTAAKEDIEQKRDDLQNTQDSQKEYQKNLSYKVDELAASEAEQAALQVAEALAHLQSNVHVGKTPSSGPQVRTKRRISRLSSRKKVLPPEKPIVSSSIMHTGWLSHSGTFCVMLSSSA